MTRICIVVGLALIAMTSYLFAGTSSTTFTYQGELQQRGTVVTGPHDMVFSLWDSLAGGLQLGSDIVLDDVSVTDGQFTVQLDFGAAAFDNSNRWLEITVEGFTLAPRQPITRAPYSIQTRGIFVDANNNVGIGTTNPQRPLEIEAFESVIRLSTTDDSPTTVSRLEFKSVDNPSPFTPLGRIDFLDENDTLRAVIQGNESGPVDARMVFSVTPGQSPQMEVLASGVRFQNQIKPPIAYGMVNTFGELLSGSSNITSVTSFSVGEFRVHVEGGLLDTDIAVASLRNIGLHTVRIENGYLRVNTFSTLVGNPEKDRDFTFVIYRQ